MFRKIFRARSLLALAALATALTLVAADVEARVGGGSSSGSRGSRTFSAPPSTRTAPTQAAPMQRTITQPGQTAPTGGFAGSASRPGLFGGGLLGGLAAGFIGAGLFGMLFGHGFFGGMGGFASLLGLLFQIGLIVIVARLAFAWWQRRNNPAYASAAAQSSGSAGAQDFRSRFDNLTSGFGGGASGGGEPVTIGKADYDAFQDILTKTQAAYSDEDLNTLRNLVTPEMASYFADDLAANASRGLVNKVSDVNLLQGDLSEAWREGNTEYATVAMRFSLNDRMVDRASGREVEGGPQEATEVWTFMRSHGGHWILSAIQQA